MFVVVVYLFAGFIFFSFFGFGLFGQLVHFDLFLPLLVSL